MSLLDPRFLLTNLAIVINLVGGIIAVLGSGRSHGARRFSWWMVLNAVGSVGGLTLALLHKNNHGFYLVYRLCSVLLLAATAQVLVTSKPLRQVAVLLASVYVVLWLGLTVSGIEAINWISIYTSPGEKAYGVIVGTFLVATSIRDSDGSPLKHAEAWLGLGLVLASATSLVMSPIAAELSRTKPDQALLLRQMSGVFTDIAVVLWCLAYRKRSILWTR